MDWSATSILLATAGSIAAVATPVSLIALRRQHHRARLTHEGFQEMEVLVKGRYWPDTVVVRRGIPVRLYFRRAEDNPCSQRVIFSDFHVGSSLAPYRTTTVSFIPTKCGEFLFTCAFGMYQGRLVVVEPARRDLLTLDRLTGRKG